jgi:pyruvate ferredoxin oxidoreductase gamma subunit
MIEIRWHGRGGQGAFTAARLIGEASIYEGKYAQAFPTFGPERRGAPVLSFTRISDKPIYDHSELETCDYVVVLDETLYGPNVYAGIKEGGILIINTPKDPSEFKDSGVKVITIDATSIALNILKRDITNVPMAGVLAAITNIVDLESINIHRYLVSRVG